MPTRRPQGQEAPFYSEAHKRYEATITLPDGKRKTVTSSTKGTKKEQFKEANAKLAELKEQIEAGVDADKGNQTVQKYIEEWRASYQLEVRDSTYVKRQAFFDDMVSEFGHFKLKDLRPEHLQKWVIKLAKRLAPSSLKICYGLFKQILADAVEQGYLIASPCRGIKRTKVEEVEMNILDSEQRKAFLAYLSAHPYEGVENLTREQRKAFNAYLSAHRYESLFVVALTAGMRISEIRAAKWSDIDFEKGTWGEISVRGNLVFLSHVGYVEHKPKTKAGTRNIPLTELAFKKLRAHRAVQQEQYLKAGVSWDEEVLVWQGIDGIDKPFSDSTICRALNKALEECGLPIIRIHDLRHTAITWMLTCRMQIRTVQKLAGHARIEQTLQYFVVLPETIKEDMILFNASVAAAS